MELRKDPITQGWVIQEDGEVRWPDFAACPLCPGHEALSPQTIYAYPEGNNNWQVRVTPHPRPLYHIEGDAQRRAEGIYDKMQGLGAHEIVVESPDHNLPLSQQSDESIGQVLRAYVARIADLKGDRRFRYVSVFRNAGAAADQELVHPHSEITATPFIPRGVVIELRSFKQYFEVKERCLLCDIVKEEMTRRTRAVDWDDQFVAFCPFASRAPYETWILPVNHHCSFEEDLVARERQVRLARFLKSLLQRLEGYVQAYHMVLHTCPNAGAKFEKTGQWRTLREDFHWHFEILPLRPQHSKSYSLTDVLYNSLPPELAAEELRGAGLEAAKDTKEK